MEFFQDNFFYIGAVALALFFGAVTWTVARYKPVVLAAVLPLMCFFSYEYATSIYNHFGTPITNRPIERLVPVWQNYDQNDEKLMMLAVPYEDPLKQPKYYFFDFSEEEMERLKRMQEEMEDQGLAALEFDENGVLVVFGVMYDELMNVKMEKSAPE